LFNRYFWYRSGRPIDIEEKLEIKYIKYGSPLTVVVVVAGWVAVKVVEPLVRISGEIADWSSERRKAKAEAVKAELEVLGKAEDLRYKQIRNRRAEVMIDREIIRTQQEAVKLEDLREKRKADTLKQLERRLCQNKYKLVDFSTSKEDKPKELE
jgi:hypothetical protein